MTVIRAEVSPDVAAAVWLKFICRACGLVYDEAEGDADGGIAPGTRFADIPDDWACPLCGVTKADFEPYDDVPAPRRRDRPTAPVSPVSPVAPVAPVSRGRSDAGVVIVGAGRAGWQMAAALRERDPDLPIRLVSACDAAVYDKPQLSVAHARAISVGALVREAAADAAARLGVTLHARTEAIRVVASASLLRTTRGTLRWRHLVLAHGAAPRHVAGLPASLCWRINDLQTYRRFRATLGEPGAAAPPGRGVLIAGAGLVGSELANDLALAGHEVTLLDIAPRPLAALLDAGRSEALLRAWADLPVRFEGGVRIDSVERGRDGRLVVLSADGRRFDAAHVVAATGLETPGRLAASAGLAWSNGIAVDRKTLQTSVPSIHALGDCISIDGEPLRYIEPIARQARLIADRITGREPPPYRPGRPPIRIKTTSLPMTV